jgi:hypothetical protein
MVETDSRSEGARSGNVLSWLASFFVAILAAGAACVGTGLVANLYVDLYHMTSREGASGYFIVSMAFLGLVGGFVLGLVEARVVAASAQPGFWKATGVVLVTLTVVLGGAALIERGLADVPPEIDGEQLWLQVEVRPPLGWSMPPGGTAPAQLRLGSVSGRTVRKNVRGALFAEDARIEDGRAIVPGAVELFTERGDRLLQIVIGTREEWFGVDVPRHPGRKLLAWSAWISDPERAARKTGNQMSYRFRLLKRSEPVRIQTFGPFEVATIASSFYEAGEGVAASSELEIRSGGKLLAFETEGHSGTSADAVAVLPAPSPALLAHSWDTVFLVADQAGHVGPMPLAQSSNGIDVVEVTSDSARFRTAKAGAATRGFVDRARLPEQGVFLVGQEALVDSRSLTVRRFRVPREATLGSLPPLGLSPDGRSVVRFAYRDGDEANSVLAVTDTVSGGSSLLPIDRVRMRFYKPDGLDPDWVAHYFEWHRGEDGVDHLRERASFKPLPYRGELQTWTDGRRVYWIEPAGEPIRAALVALLVAEMGATTLPGVDEARYSQPVQIGAVRVSISRGDKYVAVETERTDADQGLIVKIAERFNAELATGKHDDLFRAAPQ